MLKVIVWTFVIVFLYRFVTRFVLPIFNMTRSAQERLRQMQQQMQDMQNNANTPPPTPKQPPRHIDGDYIEYEEVK